MSIWRHPVSEKKKNTTCFYVNIIIYVTELMIFLHHHFCILVFCYSSHWIKLNVGLGCIKHAWERVLFLSLFRFYRVHTFLHVCPSLILSASQGKLSLCHFTGNFSSSSLLWISLILNLMGFRLVMEMNLWASLRKSLG